MVRKALWSVAVSLRRADGEGGWARDAADFTAQLATQESATVIGPEVWSVSRRGRSEVRVNIAMAVEAADPAQAMTVAWLVIRKASSGRLDQWDLASVRTEIRGETAG